MAGKSVESVKQIDPGIRRVAVICNSRTTPLPSHFCRRSKPLRSNGVKAIAADVYNAVDRGNALVAQGREPDGGIIVPPDSFLPFIRITAAAQYRLPAIYNSRKLRRAALYLIEIEVRGSCDQASAAPTRVASSAAEIWLVFQTFKHQLPGAALPFPSQADTFEPFVNMAGEN